MVMNSNTEAGFEKVTTSSMGLQKLLTLSFVVMFYQARSSDSYKILVSGDTGGGSHYYILERIAKALAQRDHHVTVYVSDMYAKQREVSPLKFVIYESTIASDELEGLLTNITSSFLSGEDFLSQILSQIEAVPLVFKITRDHCNAALSDKPLLNYLRHQHFDIIIGDLYSRCVALIAQALDKPFILITCPMPTTVQYAIYSNPVNPSYMPSLQTGFDSHMTFPTRLMNTIQIVVENIFSLSILGDFDRLKEIHNIKKEMSTYRSLGEAELNFLNTDFTLDFARPLMPNTIPVGGILTGPAKAVDLDIEEFVQGAEQGTIVFSLGEFVSIMKQDIADMFAKAFGKLSQRVIWKQRGKTHSNIPPNVKMMKRIPQNDLLGHPNTRLLVYHCGINGVYEAIYHGVPVICLPVFYDQLDVAQRVPSKGAGLRLDINSLTSDVLVEAIQHVLNDKSFRSNMETLSRIFKDKPNHPADEVALWTEYVVRHNGTEHLRSSAKDLNIFQYLLLDILLFLITCALIVIVVGIGCCKCCLGLLKSKLGGVEDKLKPD